MSNVLFTPIEVSPKDLWLDPNNPRLVDDFGNHEVVDDQSIGDKQIALEAKFSEAATTNDDFTSIKEVSCMQIFDKFTIT